MTTSSFNSNVQNYIDATDSEIADVLATWPDASPSQVARRVRFVRSPSGF